MLVDLIGLLGIALIGVGFFFIYPPSAAIVVGTIFFFLAMAMARGKPIAASSEPEKKKG